MVIKEFKYWSIIEITIIAIGSIFFCKDLLDFNPQIQIGGTEYILLIQTHFIWELLPKCGSCILWNGFINGGAPTFAEIHGAPMHPLVFLPAIFLGAINGSKITLLLSFFVAGIGQWRLSKFLGLGRIARIWSAYIIMFGGELSGKLEIGNVVLILSTACCILFFSELYHFSFSEMKKSSIIRFGIFYTLCALAGQGYLILAVTVIWMPIAFLFRYKAFGKQSVHQLVEGLGLSFLLGGFYFIPLMHFSTNILKNGDQSLVNLQPIGYSVLNLVIHDTDFYHAMVLGQDGSWYTYATFIGWIPILLALFALIKQLSNNERKMEIFWLIISFICIYIFSSQELYFLLGRFIPSIYKLRYASIITGLAVSPLIALSGMGLDQILKIPASSFSWKTKENNVICQISMATIVVFGLVLLSVSNVYRINRKFLYTVWVEPPATKIQEVLLSSKPGWVELDNRSHFPFLFQNLIKVSGAFRPWYWKDHPDPDSITTMLEYNVLSDTETDLQIGNNNIYFNEEAKYAGIYDDNYLISTCHANTTGGGLISISCENTDRSYGKLIIQENYYSGWNAWMDGKKINLDPNETFLTINNIPIGKHEFILKYQPWDIWLGLLMTIIGIAYCFFPFGTTHKERESQ